MPDKQRYILAIAAFITLGLTLRTPSVFSEEKPVDQKKQEAYVRALASVEADLSVELNKLSELRKRIAAEKPALAKETASVAAEVRQKRRDAELAKQERDAVLHDLSKLSNQVRLWRDERSYIDHLLMESHKLIKTQIHLAEETTFKKITGADDKEKSTETLIAASEKAIQGLAPLRGMHVIEGEVLAADSLIHKGRFVEAGPVSWFVSNDNKVSGLVDVNHDLRLEVVPETADASKVEALLQHQATTMVFDPTLGSAIAIGGTEVTLAEHIRQGGFWVYPILALALVATLAAIFKWLQVWRIRDISPRVLAAVIEAVNRDDDKEAELEAGKLRHPAAKILKRGIEVRQRPRDQVDEALYEKYLEAQSPLQRGLSLIAITSATAPLLGLLGTVTGMIHTFKLINIFGTGDARYLASGISEALVSTEFGLVVAIPALIMHALLQRKIQGIITAMEMTSLAFVNGLKDSTSSGVANPPIVKTDSMLPAPQNESVLS